MTTDNNNFYTLQIRNILIERHPNILLLWLPGHCNITGNEYADQAAKYATTAPVYATRNIDHKDLNKFIFNHYRTLDRELTFNSTSDWYKTINTDRKYIRDVPLNSNRSDFVKFTRLRLGHTRITHGHLMQIQDPPYCNCVVNTNNPLHFLSECPKFNTTRLYLFKNANPKSLLSNHSSDNILTISKFLRKTNLCNKI